MSQFVDECDLGMASEDRVDIHLGEVAAAVVDGAARDDLEVADGFGGVWPTVGLDETDDDIGAAFGPTMAFAEHREGLADAWGRAEIDAQRATRT